MRLGCRLVVVVTVSTSVTVASIVVIDSVIVAVSVVFKVTTGGVTVTLLLTIGVTTVWVEAVCVTVIEVVVGVCRQEHKNARSEDGRARMLENMLDCAADNACLRRTNTVGYTVSVL